MAREQDDHDTGLDPAATTPLRTNPRESSAQDSRDPSASSIRSFRDTPGSTHRSSLDSSRASRVMNVDDSLPAGPSKLSKLIPGRAEKKRRRREEAEAELAVARTAAQERRQADLQSPIESSVPSSRQASMAPEVIKDEVNGSHGEPVRERDTQYRPADIKSSLSPSASPLCTRSNTKTSIHQPSSGSKTSTLQSNLRDTSAVGSSSSSMLNTPIEFGTKNATSTAEERTGRSNGHDSASVSRGVSPGARIKDVLSVASRRPSGAPPPKMDLSNSSTLSKSSPSPSLSSKIHRKSVNIPLVPGNEGVKAAPAPAAGPRLTVSTARSTDIPTIVTTPTTPVRKTPSSQPIVTPPTPTGSTGNRHSEDRPSTASSDSPAVEQSTYRRLRSNSGARGSKLQNQNGSVLTPMPEESRTASGNVRSASSASAGGFFSTMITAAQTVTSTLTSSIGPTAQSKASAPTDGGAKEADVQADQSILEDGDKPCMDRQHDNEEAKRPLAVETLGTGELGLHHLGIESDSKMAKSQTNLSNAGALRKLDSPNRDMTFPKRPESPIPRLSTTSYIDRGIGETPVVNDSAHTPKPRSLYEPSIAPGDQTPPPGSIHDGGDLPRRNGSVRSRVGGVVRKHRNSSSATTNTLGAALAAAGPSLANPAGQRPGGFALAGRKRNREFHQLFKSIPDDDSLIEDYSCALQREIILAGRIYVSERHICFSSNILGWVTTLIIGFDEIVSVEKENTAVVFPNAIAIQTLHARQTFRSLLSREGTYDLLIAIWKVRHPNLQSSLNGARLDQGGTGDKTEKLDSSASASDGTSETSNDDEEVYDEDDEDESAEGSDTEDGGGGIDNTITGNGAAPTDRKTSSMGAALGNTASTGPTSNDAKAAEKASSASAAANDFPGPASHVPTECSDGDSHYDKLLKDDIVPAPVGKVYSMIFGPASGGFMARWLVDDMKCTELSFEHDNKGLTEENKSRSMTYVKPLTGSIGPKSTKCVVTETLDYIDFEKAVSVTASTQTPDVPSGNVFVTKTHFCLMWAANNATRVVINYTIEWSGKSWLKGPIEKGATDGQTTYCNDLIKALKAGVSSTKARSSNGKSKGQNGKKRKGSSSAKSTAGAGNETSPQDSSTKGFLEPLQSIISPISSQMSSLFNAHSIIAILLLFIVYNHFRGPSQSSTNSAHPSSASQMASSLGDHPYYAHQPISHAARIAAYEDIWRREESAMWDWLDSRLGRAGPSHKPDESHHDHKHAFREKLMDAKQGLVEDVKMAEHEIERAIKATEEKLFVLRQAVKEKKSLEEGVGKEREGEKEKEKRGEEVHDAPTTLSQPLENLDL